jgi:hypothetical protein
VSLESTRRLAAEGRLYPAVILHGGTVERRRRVAVELARALQCEREVELRPCGECRHCRRIVWPEKGETAYHPDFQVLERDLKTSTSVEATRAFLRGAQVSPFEARGQVFVFGDAETLSGEAANALLKTLEEPHDTAPRHFFLLAPSHLDLLPTLRSRSLSVFLGPAEPLDPDEVAPLAAAFARAISAWADGGAEGGVHLLVAAAALATGGGWEDPRASRPWALAASAVVAAVRGEVGGVVLDRPGPRLPDWLDRPLLSLAEDLLLAPAMRVRGISRDHILEGLVCRHLARLPTGVGLPAFAQAGPDR